MLQWFVFSIKVDGEWEPRLMVKTMYRRDAIELIGYDKLFRMFGTNQWMCKKWKPKCEVEDA